MKINEIIINGEKCAEVVNIGSDGPVVGVVGLVHGDEACGRAVLDQLRKDECIDGLNVRLIYANLFAEQQKKRCVEANLNRVFPGNVSGKLEEQIAHALTSYLRGCDFVIDIHATYDETPAFAISTVDNIGYERLAAITGLENYVVMTNKLANGKALIDFVNQNGGKGISFEAGKFDESKTTETAINTVMNFLNGIKKGSFSENGGILVPNKYVAKDVVIAKTADFVPYFVEPFKLLRAGTAYGKDSTQEHSLTEDTFPVLSVRKPLDGMVFLKTDEVR